VNLPTAATVVPAGLFRLRPADPARDLDLLHGWMNDPQTAAYWELEGPRERTEEHLAQQSALDYTWPYLGLLDGEPMSYWEVYRADLDPLLAGRYPALPHDAGVHILIGPAGYRGRGIGAALLRDMAARLLAADPRAARVVAEPDVRNERSVRAFRNAGFRRVADLDLADKRAALMVRDRAPRPGPPPAAATVRSPPSETRGTRT
jgi:acetyl CoA:N6-hydroxylysine acetyl transferase